MALTPEDIEEIKVLYDKGTSTSAIGKLYNVSGSYIRKLAKDNGWKREANIKTKEAIRAELALILKRARAPENYGQIGNEYVKQAILHDLSKGVTETVAAKRVGLTPGQFKRWRRDDIEFDQLCNEKMGDFIAWHEMNAGAEKQSPKDSLNMLSRHPLSKETWAPREDKNVIKIEFAYDRHSNDRHSNVIDGDFREVKELEAPQTEGRD